MYILYPSKNFIITNKGLKPMLYMNICNMEECLFRAIGWRCKETIFETTYFKDAFILQEATRYDIRGKKEIGALRKYYFVDTGLRNSQLNFAYPDERQLLENIVYNELIYNGYTVNVRTFDTVEKNKTGKSIRKTNEIDFFAQKNERKFYIQISTDVSNSETKDREIRPFIKLNDQIQKILVVNKPYKAMVDNQRYIIIGASEFLLNYIK